MIQHETVIDRNASGSLDICRGKHGGNSASVAAHDKAMRGAAKMYMVLTSLFKTWAGTEEFPNGLTTHEIAQLLQLSNRNKFAPRLSEMKAAGLIEETGQMRGGCHVLRLVEKQTPVRRAVTPEELMEIFAAQ